MKQEKESTSKVVVFAGSSDKVEQDYLTLAYEVGRALKGYDVVTGGSKTGLMGKVGFGAQSVGSKVIGVSTPLYANIDKEMFENTIIVPNLYERLRKYNELGDSFIILPGGFGTLDEFFNLMALSAWEGLKKPIILVNYNGYYDPLIEMMKKIKDENFGVDYQGLIQVVSNVSEISL